MCEWEILVQTDPNAPTVIDADEWEAAQRDPRVDEFARQADATLEAMRREGRIIEI